MLRYNNPNDVIRYFMVLMTQDVPNAANLFPRQIWRECQQFIRNMPGSLRNDFQRSLDAETQQPVLLKIRQ